VSLFYPQSGYLLSYQRLVALLSQAVDVLYAPAFFIVFALVAQLLFCMVVWAKTNRIGTFGKILLTVTPFLIPTGGDALLNLTNSMWVLALGLVLLMLSDAPGTRRQWCFHILYLLISGLTGPFVILFAPFILIRFWLLRREAPVMEWWRVGLYLVVLAVNFAALQSGIRGYPELCPDIWKWMELFKNLALPYFIGVLDHFRHPGGASVLLLSIVLTLSLLPLCFHRGLGRRELLDRLVLACCGLAILASSLWQWRDRPHIFMPYFGFDRYCFVIYGCLSCTLVHVAVVQAKGGWGRICQAAAAAILLLSTFFSVMNAGQKLPWPDMGYPQSAKTFNETGKAHFQTPPEWGYDLQRH